VPGRRPQARVQTQLRRLQPLRVRRPPHSHLRSRTSKSCLAARDRSCASDRFWPYATQSPSQLCPQCQARSTPCTRTPRSYPLPRRLPCRAPILHRALSRSRSFPHPNVSSPLQHPSDRCNICSILLKHTCIVIATFRWNTWNMYMKIAETFGTYIYIIRMKQMKHAEYTLETYVCSHCNICNIRPFCNFKAKQMKHTDEIWNILMKRVKHTPETTETLETYTCNVRI
jgi:hypothetical protein